MYKPRIGKVTESTFVEACALVFWGAHFWVLKTSYATAEDSDSERAKNQSGSEAAERQRSGHVVHMTGANYLGA